MSKAQCLDCLGFMESKHRHDFVRCECGNAFLDGGDGYPRLGGRIVIVGDKEGPFPIRPNGEISELLEDIIMDDMFDNEEDYDLEGFNLGYQAGAMDERDRIIRLIQEKAGDFLDQHYDKRLMTVTPLLDTDGLIELIRG